MIIENQDRRHQRRCWPSCSAQPDARFKEIMAALVRHLHAFTREVKLTEAEFQTKPSATSSRSASTPTRPTTRPC